MWSSAKSHVNKVSDPVLAQDCILEKEIMDGSEYLKEMKDKQATNNIRKSSLTGRPCGDDSFMQKIEGILGRCLTAIPWGRPRKSN